MNIKESYLIELPPNQIWWIINGIRYLACACETSVACAGQGGTLACTGQGARTSLACACETSLACTGQEGGMSLACAGQGGGTSDDATTAARNND